MGLLDQARIDLEQISGNTNDFGVEITINKDNVDYVVTGFHTKHHTGYDTDGVRISTKIASVGFSEKKLTDLGCTVRNAKDEVLLNKSLVNVKDSTGDVKSYICRESYPDEALGFIILILGDYE